MNEFIAETKLRDGIVMELDNPAVRAQVEKTFGLTKTPQSEALAQKLAADQRKLENLYIARDNMIDKSLSVVGKNLIKDWIKANPAKAKAIGWLVGSGVVTGGGLLISN